MAEEMRNLGSISPDFVYGSSARSVSLENQEKRGGQSQRPPSIEKEERPAFEPEQAEGSGVGLHSATQARQVKGNAKPDSGGGAAHRDALGVETSSGRSREVSGRGAHARGNR
eukprot:SAG11_NODE_401_length_9759_cov_119.937992_6_plen_113_part_00